MIVEFRGQEVEIPEYTIMGYVREFRMHGEMERWRLVKLRDALHNMLIRIQEKPEHFDDVLGREDFIQAHAMRQAFKNCGIMEFDA